MAARCAIDGMRLRVGARVALHAGYNTMWRRYTNSHGDHVVAANLDART